MSFAGHKHSQQWKEESKRRQLGSKKAEVTRKKISDSKLTKNPTYKAIHTWLTKNYSKGISCENSEELLHSKKLTWAKKKGLEYERLRENFIVLCTKCHHSYDNIPANLKAKENWKKPEYRENIINKLKKSWKIRKQQLV